MRICILTQPLHSNYGGLLQAYALQTVLKRMGHDVWTENRKPNTLSKLDEFKYFIKQILALCPFQNKYKWEPSEQEIYYIRRNTDKFINKYIKITEPVKDTKKKCLEQYDFQAYVVGSDQVWRPCYSYGIENYFLDFLYNKNVKRVSYAASFGTDTWEFSQELTDLCSKLIDKFDAVSVREKSGIDLCRKYFKTNAVQVLDPTMLLEKQDYIDLVINEKEEESIGNLFTYVLDESIEKENLINHIAKTCNMKVFRVMPNKRPTFSNLRNHIEECVYPSVTKWIRAFMDAEMVITDSFHGCVFSIIFNKPFWVVGNNKRGLSRFNSLLSMFGLQSRIIDTDISKNFDFNKQINWEEVNIIRKNWQDTSYEFLYNNIKNCDGK